VALFSGNRVGESSLKDGSIIKAGNNLPPLYVEEGGEIFAPLIKGFPPVPKNLQVERLPPFDPIEISLFFSR